jgi:Domain of unknown function (DUF4918)
MFSTRIAAHFAQLPQQVPVIPDGIEWLLPLAEFPESEKVFHTFLEKYYADESPRNLIVGINPGRFGGGITNVAFTDPWHLQHKLGIANSFAQKTELSAHFIYAVIDAFGGADAFYQRFFINSVCPFGFVKGGINYNYYDDPALQKAVLPFIKWHFEKLLETGLIERERCFCLGEGKNYAFLNKLNQAEGYFGEIVPLAHPRFVMQYRRKTMTEYVESYLAALS